MREHNPYKRRYNVQCKTDNVMRGTITGEGVEFMQ